MLCVKFLKEIQNIFVMQGTARPGLPWEDPENLKRNNEEPVTSFENAHDLMITVLNHQMFQFNKYLLQRISVDSVVSFCYSPNKKKKKAKQS